MRRRADALAAASFPHVRRYVQTSKSQAFIAIKNYDMGAPSFPVFTRRSWARGQRVFRCVERGQSSIYASYCFFGSDPKTEHPF
jgi:hypothetical protein